MSRKSSLKIKKAILIVVIFLNINLYAQDFNKIKKSDTIYVFFKQHKYKQQFFKQNREYIFIFDKYIDFKHINFYYKKEFEIVKKKKSFLIDEKNLILDYEFIDNMFRYEQFKAFLKTVHKIYIIDFNDITRRNIILREVKFNDVNLNPTE